MQKPKSHSFTNPRELPATRFIDVGWIEDLNAFITAREPAPARRDNVIEFPSGKALDAIHARLRRRPSR